MSDCRHKFSQEVVRQPEVEFCDYCGLQQPIANHPASPTERLRDLEAQLQAAQKEIAGLKLSRDIWKAGGAWAEQEISNLRDKLAERATGEGTST